MTNENEADDWDECPQCDRRTRTERMGSRGPSVVVAGVELPRFAVAGVGRCGHLAIPPGGDPRALDWRQNEVARAVDAVTTALGQLGAKPSEPGPA